MQLAIRKMQSIRGFHRKQVTKRRRARAAATHGSSRVRTKAEATAQATPARAHYKRSYDTLVRWSEAHSVIGASQSGPVGAVD